VSKVRVATVWLSGCAGCHMSFLDLDEALIDIAGRIELHNSPLTDLKTFPEDGVDVTLIEGAVANEEHLEVAHKAREKSKIIIAFGDCAVTGNVPALRNRIVPADLLEEIYGRERTANGVLPTEVIPRLLDRVRPVHEVIRVEYYLHGCPPSPAVIRKTLLALLDGEEPQLVGEDLLFG